MTPALWTLLILLTALSAGTLVYWLAVAFHVARTVLRVPTARDGLALPEAAKGPELPRVCLIAPAHNEQAVIEGLARSVLAQDYPNLRIVFSLDRCTDKTRQILDTVVGERAGKAVPPVEILELTECPPEWAGKVNALWQAVRTSSGARDADVLLFVDADTILQPECIRATVALMLARELDVLSLLSTLTVDTWFERLIQPATAMELMRQYPIERANRQEKRRAFANGQYLMFTRRAYEDLGGHESVRSELVEDIHFARLAERHAKRVGVFLADGLMHCRMYRDWAAYRRGWQRIFAEAANLKPRRLRTSAMRVRAVGAVLPLCALAAVGAGFMARDGAEVGGLARITAVLGAAALLAFVGTIIAAYRIGRAPLTSAAAYPVGAWLTGSLLRRAARDLEANRPTQWGGKAYHRPAR